MFCSPLNKSKLLYGVRRGAFVSCFCFGQTGAGKTHTMFGELAAASAFGGLQQQPGTGPGPAPGPGIVLFAIEHLLELVHSAGIYGAVFNCSCSCSCYHMLILIHTTIL